MKKYLLNFVIVPFPYNDAMLIPLGVCYLGGNEMGGL